MEDHKNTEHAFGRIVLKKEKQKLNALKEKKQAEWFGLGMFGMVGWSVTIPMLLATLGGIWLDKHYPQSFSWTITGLIMGLVTGCSIAWNWLIKENK